ncbi:CRE-BUS-19 protein [Caenorhabditis remanei]|uniref:CRE-BUS-19 protein n=1 Tax=Caenorhabditis remanei TaxID=31234 RepID=E3LTW9_CAERE|nr:CRE-BUS-19 protein [Caenorhabditis remanei]
MVYDMLRSRMARVRELRESIWKTNLLHSCSIQLFSRCLRLSCPKERAYKNVAHQIRFPEGGVFEIPKQFDNFTVLADKFRAYKEDHFGYITTLFICAYLYKQTFAIPGSFLLNVIAGVVYDLWSGFILCCCLTTLGSTLCYLFSELFGREYVFYYFGQKLTYLQQKIDDNSNRLLPFLLFARMFPISPSWLLNIVAPFLNIPLPIFVVSALFGKLFSLFCPFCLNLVLSSRFRLISQVSIRICSGLAPYNFICVQAGYILRDLRSWDDVFSTTTMLKLFSFALIPLAYAIYIRPRANKHQLVSSSDEMDEKVKKMEIV